MPNGASIVVDIKAQITGYQELIEKIKAELKKIDPGANIGKGLNRALALAETKLTLLSRNAEKRITSEGLLEHLFDLLHMVNDLMRNLGQGMSNVGLNDVLETASEKARELGNSLREVKTEMAQKGNTFFEDLKKTNPKELLAVFDELKFDPKTMGIDTFVESFKLATESAKTEVEDLKNKLREAQAELERTSSMKARRDLLPVALLGTKVAQEAIRNTFGARNNLDAAKLVSDRNAEILAFVDKIKAGIESDTTRSDANKENAVNTLSESITKLLDAKTDEQVKQILSDLDKALKSTKGEGLGGSHAGIKGLSGESLNTELILKLSLTTYLADQDFVNKIQEVVKLLNDSSNSGANGAGARISEILNALLLPTDVATFNDNMNALIRSLLEGLLKVNKASGDFDTTAKSNVVKTTEEALEAAKLRASNLETVAKSLAYTNLEQEYRALSQRLSEIELALGLERNNNRAGVAGDIKNVGKGVLDHAAKSNNDAINSLKEYGSMLEDVLARLQMVGKIEGIAQRWFSVYAAVRMVSKAFLSMILTVTNLDKTITEIAIVTDMSQGDLWKLMPEYTNIARKYGASLEGVYLVSQLYYQQGLEQADVMALTEETLKMARISGLGYSEATDYMTNAIRSFKIEMQDAGRVVDVYSALAATSASSTTELATAMSKTASSAAAVGSSFEATATMMAVMIETTRESPENIGSALKSIISRYGELKENKTGIDEEGEEYSLNKVDTALLSVGISIHDAQGQFRDFDDVIMELAKSWDTIDTNTLRYIATVMAGNRQQSRFLALVSNGARLAEEMEVANNSEDAATLLMLKTMDSIDYKSQLLLTSLLSLYTSTGIENMFKGILDGANLIVETFTLMPTVFLLPIPAIASLATNFISMANIVMTTIRVLKQKFMAQLAIDNATLKALNLASGTNEIATTAATEGAKTKIVREEAEKRRSILAGELSGLTKMNPKSKIALGALLAGTALNLGAGLISDKGVGNRGLKAGFGIAGSALQYGALGFLLTGTGIGAGIGALIGGLMGVWLNISYIWESTAAQAKRLKEEAEEAATDAKIKLSQANSAEKEIANLKKLEAERYKSAEANLKYIEAANKAAEDIPELVSYYDSEGNAILDLSNAYAILAAKRKEANNAAVVASSTSIQAAEKSVQEKSEVAKEAVSTQLSKTLDDDNFKGVVKEKWQELEKLAPNFDFGHGLQLFNVKWGNAALSDIVGYADDNTFTNTPELMKLRNMLSTGDVKGISNILNNPNQRKIQFNLWESELNNITDPFSKALMDFVLAQLQTVSAEVVDTLGDLSLSKAVYKSEIHSAAVTKISNFLSEQLLLADYGELGDPKAEFAKNTLLRFKDFNGSNEIAVDYLESAYINGLNKTWKNWEEFEQILNDPELSPLLEVIEILADIPQTSLDKLNELYTNKSNLTQVEFTNLLTDLIPGQTQKFYDLLSVYYLNAFNDWDTVLSSESWQNYKLRPLISSKTKGEFGPEELRRILNQYEGLNKLYNQGKITYTDANQISTNYSSILRYSATLNDNNKEIVQNILTNTDFTLESLTDAINQILNNTDLSEGEKLTIIPKLTAILSAIPVNINTTIETYLDEYAEKTENLSKDLSKATKGMTQKDALKMAEDLKIDTSTKYFDVKKGKLFLKDTNLLYNSYFGEDSSLNELNEKISQLKEELKKIKDPTKLTESKFDHISANEITSINKAWTDWSKTNGENWQAFIEYYFTGRINEVKLLSEDLMNSIRLESAIDNGNLEEIIKAAMTGTAKDIPKFLITPISKILTALLLQSLQSGNFTNLINNNLLSQEFKEQLPVMEDAYNKANSTILTSLTNNIGAGIEYIEANDYNRILLSDMADNGLAKLNKDASGKVIGATINNTVDNIGTIYRFIKNYTTPVGFNKTEILAKLKLQQYTTRTKSGTLAEIVKNADAISATAVENFKSMWGNTAEISAFFKDNGNGTYKATEDLYTWIQNHLEELDDSASAAALEMLALRFDNNLSNIKNAVSYVTSGAKNQSEIDKLITAAKDVGVTIDQSNFSFDAITNAWTLDPAILTKYVEAQALELVRLGLLTTKELQSYIDTNVRLTLALSIDIGSFLDAENKRATGKSYLTLKKSLVNYFNSSDVLLEKLREDYIESQVPKTAPQDIQGYIRSAIRSYASADTIADYYISLIKQGGTNAVQIMRAVADALGKELGASDIEAAYRVEVSEIENALDQLTYGIGSIVSGKAVKILQDAGYDLAYLDENNAVITGIQDISAAYQAYYDALVESGEATLAAINEAKAKILETKDNRGKEQSAIDALSDATGMTYTAFAEILSNAGIEMTDELIALLEKDSVIKHVGGNKMSIIDFSKFASAMGWNFNSEEYISAFKSYNDSLIEMNRKAEKNIVEEVTALKDAKPGDKLNVTLLWAALRANANEAILDNLRGQLNIYGAAIKDGILTLDESANLYEIARAIEQAAQDANLDLQDGLQEIADTVKEILQSYVETIKKGILGGLTNKDASQLQSVAILVGYNQDLRFVETTEGLKLAQNSAIGLYMALKDIDAMQASLVFDELNNSLKEANEHYQSISSILARILEIESLRSKGKSNKALEEELALAKEILAVRSTTEDEGFSFMSNKIPAALNNPLNYAKNWTLALLSLQDAFKIKKGGKTGFLDYTDFYNIVTEMNNIAALGEPIKFGAYTLDGSLESAAALIEKGAASLTAVDTGEVMVNLSSIGFNMAKGGKTMQDGVTDGIHSLAQSQIDMLDGLIAVLETIVAMEQLGDVAGEDMNIDLGDIFDITYNDDDTIQSINGFTSDFDKARQTILEKAAEGTELRSTLDHTKIKMGELMRSMTDLLTMSAENLFPDTLGPEGQRAAKESYLKMMNALYQAAISGEYDLDNIADSVKKVVEASGIDLQDFVFEYTDKEGKVTRVFTYVGETMVDIDFTNDDIRKQVNTILKKDYKNADEYRAAILAAIDSYKTGKNANGGLLTLDEKYDARTLIGLASNEFVLTDNKNGTYTGTYQGLKFTGTRDDVLRAMAEAATYKDAGYDFTVETKDGQITVKGKTKIGKTEVEIVTNKTSGELEYKYKGETYTSKDAIMGALAEDGKIEDTGTYAFTDKGGRMHVTEVKKDAVLSLTYTYYVDENNKRHYKYNGQDFESYDAMRSYMEVKNEYDPTGGKEHIDQQTKASYIEVNKHATVKYTITAKGITPTYEIDDKPVGDKAAFDAYCLAYALEGIDISTAKDISNNERVILYNYNDTQLQVRINLDDGGVTYSYDGKDGFTVQSESESAVKAAIAAHYQMLSETQKDTTEQAVDITIELGVNVKFVIKDGKVEIAEGQTLDDKQQAAAEQLKAKMQAELDKNPQTLKNPVKAEATSVTLTLAGNALVTLEGDVKLSKAIENATGDVNTLTLTAKTIKGEGDSNLIDVNITQLPDLTLDANIDGVKNKIDEAVNYAKSQTAFLRVDAGGTNVPQLITANQDTAKSKAALQDILVGSNAVPGKVDSNVTYAASRPAKLPVTTSDGGSTATGNIGLAGGNAKAQGTLMGELGPELVVSNGRYFVAGQNGPEMVDLADDAIVFNHLQTKSLLEKGTSPGRGKAITNERNAVAFATGNINGGPAMASASAALAALKQLRAQWQALAGLSVKDLAGKGGGGGGGGGGDPKAFVKDLERWYNWLQQIALLEKEINLEEAKRSRYLSSMISMGREYADSQLVTIDKLKQQIAVLESLNRSQEAYFEKRRKELNENSAFKALYQFDENGQLKYKPGQFEWLSDLVGRDSVTGEANYTAKEQYEKLVAAGYGELMKYDASGNEIKQEGNDWYVTAIQAFWDKIEAERQEMQSLHDDVMEGQVKEEELMTDLNEILNNIEDNLIAVEDKVLKAVEETRLREIDAIQDEKDAIEKSSQALITGLSDLLSKEQDMYSRQLDSNELSRLQRLLSILQRSGGSASLIASLLKDITERLLDAYFDALKAQIDALLEASDNQLQKLQELIDLMTELLAYEKEHGMLWEQVYQVMALSPELITEFITKNTEEYWGKSPADFAEDSREVLFQAEQFVLMRKNVEGGLAALVAANSPEAIAAESEKITAESEAALTSAEDTTLTNTNTTNETNTTATDNTGTSNNLNGYKYTSKFAATYSTEKGEQNTAYAWGWSNKSAKEAEMMALTRAAALAKNQKGNLLLSNIKVYDRGGMVEQDGPAFVHAKEGVLTAEQTSILRNEILSNKPNSALSMLSDLRDLWNAAERTANISHTNDASVIIENATVEMNVSRIANDYDAQRAGEQALDQMLAIARRTQAQNRVGR